MGYAKPVEPAQEAAPVVGAVPAQVVDAAGRGFDAGLARLFLAVKQPEGIRLEPPPALIVHKAVRLGLVVCPEGGDIS